MNKITVAQLKEQQQISSLDEYETWICTTKKTSKDSKTSSRNRSKRLKITDQQIYVNTADYEGSDFAFERYGSIRAWAYQALEWAYMDDYDEEAEPDDWNTVNVYRLFDGFKAEEVIDIINECWQIELAELED